MSDYITAHEANTTTGAPFKKHDTALFQHIMLKRKEIYAREGRCPVLPDAIHMSLFKTVRPNIVQSIRAFRIADLATEASRLGQHFLYASCSTAHTKLAILELIAHSFLLPKSAGKNYESLYSSLTELIHQSGPQPGFVIVLEGLPATSKFDKEARESLLDVFQDAAEFWAEHEVQCRVFFSFAQ